MSIINTIVQSFQWADFGNYQGEISPTIDNLIIGATDQEILTALSLGQVDIHWKDEDDASLLHYAACRDTNVVLTKLLELGLDVNQASNAEAGGCMALHHALSVDSISYDVVETLLTHGAQPNAVLSNGSLDTPLHLLTRRLKDFSPEQKWTAGRLVLRLQDFGADMKAVNAEGQTPMTLVFDYWDHIDGLA